MSGKITLSVLFAVLAVALSETTKSSSHHSGNHSKNTMLETQKITKINVTVFYEALCPDSAKFVTTQVYPLIANQSSPLSHYLNVTFVPYGKAKTIKTNETGLPTFKCHHGEEECLGNKYQACAVKNMHEKEKLYKYINCTMTKGPLTKGTNYSVAKECAEELKENFAALETCATGEEGTMELAYFGGVTTDAFSSGLTSVPEITFNNVYSKEKHDLAMTNLKDALCKEIPASAALAECADSKNSAPSILGASFLMLATAFAASRLY